WFHSNDIEVFLTSPSGTLSQLIYDMPATNGGGGFHGFPFSTSALIGETAQGTWVIDIHTRNPDAQALNGSGPMSSPLTGVELRLYGSTPSQDDTYFFNDEFGTAYTLGEMVERSVIGDANGGVDAINAAMVSSDTRIDLSGQTTSLISGQAVSIVGADIENAFAGDGDDLLIGSGADNWLVGGRGDDELRGRIGNDTLDGGQGDDEIIFDFDLPALQSATQTENRLDLSYLWQDQLFVIEVRNVETYSFLDQTVLAEELIDVVNGTSDVGEPDWSNGILGSDAAEDIRDTAGIDLLHAGAGHDTVYGLSGDDQLGGGSGDDKVNGGHGDDLVLGEAGRDTLTGGEGNDTLNGGLGDDLLTGAAGNDEMHGGEGSDRLIAGVGDDVLWGGDGEDRLLAGAGNDTLFGGSGDDVLFAQHGDNRLIGGAGADVLYGGSGQDVFVLSLSDDATDRIVKFDGTQGDRLIIEGAFGQEVDLIYEQRPGGTMLQYETASGFVDLAFLPLVALSAGDDLVDFA
ncbi:MAG: proprotein convertase P-domain-containing protein, partial [Pseudomonadota bacterium]